MITLFDVRGHTILHQVFESRARQRLTRTKAYARCTHAENKIADTQNHALLSTHAENKIADTQNHALFSTHAEKKVADTQNHAL